MFQGDCSDEEISEKERYYIKRFDSYRNGYNQNEGDNFGATNGGTVLTQKDIFNILACLEFASKPGQVLANMFNVSRTTISRIKRGINHNQYKIEYEELSFEEREKIYENFCNSTNFIKQKANSTIIKNKRRLSEKQVHMILLNNERKILTKTKILKKVGFKSAYAIDCIILGKSYKDYALTYKQLTSEQKEKIASLLSN